MLRYAETGGEEAGREEEGREMKKLGVKVR
jgi:hypothetical protein